MEFRVQAVCRGLVLHRLRLHERSARLYGPRWLRCRTVSERVQKFADTRGTFTFCSHERRAATEGDKKNSHVDHTSIYDRPGATYEFQKFAFRGHKKRFEDSVKVRGGARCRCVCVSACTACR